MAIAPELVVTKTSAYYNERSKFKKGPVYNTKRIWEGSKVMVYDYDISGFVQALVTRVDPEIITFEIPGQKGENSYSSKLAHTLVEDTDKPHVFLIQ